MEKFEKYIENPMFIEWVFRPTAETEEFYSRYLKAFPEEKDELLILRKQLRLLSFPPELISDERNSQLFKSTLSRMLQNKKPEKSNKFQLSFLKYAAIVVLFFAIGSVIFLNWPQKSLDLKLSEDIFLKNANQNPTLFLADGSRQVISGNNVQIEISESGKITANGRPIADLQNISQKTPDVLVVPFGKKARMILADGSRIWVNAGSRIVFPGRFTGSNREIYLIGEAYFEVAHNPKKPFLVKTSTVTVRVLGTSFNVSSYPDDDFVSAVLKEGKISMEENEAGMFDSPVELRPNQMAIFKKNGKGITISNTNQEKYTIWKEGILIFENEEIYTLITKVERFYNISIELKNPNLGKERITGKLDLNAGMPQVFEYITKVSHQKIQKINAVEYMLE